jgi:Rps23 Pro-64 3,4-dihydroxylase Tpa1-like proline 4-hydroxylase
MNKIINDNLEELFPGLVVIPNFLNNYDSVVNNINKISENKENSHLWIKATTNSGPNKNPSLSKHRTNDMILVDESFLDSDDSFLKLIGETAKLINEDIKEAIDLYKDKYKVETNLTKETPRYNTMLRYTDGQKYDQHNDWSPKNKRLISYLVYTNDDYIGGELEFVHLGIKIKPEANSMIIFPSHFLFSHIAHPVQSGTKYAIVNWILYNDLG